MKNTIKKFMSVFLAAVLLLTCAPFVGIEVKAATEGYFTYTEEHDTTITQFHGDNGDVVIPDTLGGYEVTRIGWAAFAGCTGLTSITIPDSIMSIGDSAFEDCTGLTSITIPNSVKYIGYNAFAGCTSLTSITIPDSVTIIGDDAFENTAYYNNSNNWENGVLYIGNHLIKAEETISGAYEIKDGTKTIADSAFYGCTGLTSVAIPNSVANIGGGGFRYCSGLINVVIPSNVKMIGDHAFDDCTSLTSVTISVGVTEIGWNAFVGCTSLTSITIPDSVKYIYKTAFSYCSGLENIEVSLSNSSYHSVSNCLIETDTKELVLGCKNSVIPIDGSVTSIGDYAFNGCIGLTSLTIPNSVTNIGEATFSECTNLTSITIPDSVTDIGNRSFSFCTALTSVTIPDSVTSISDDAFECCNRLTSVTIGNSVTSIGRNAFMDCTSLTSITIPSCVIDIDYCAFGYYYNDEREAVQLPSFTIYGYPNTAAETYANKNGFIFIALGEATNAATGITVEYSPKSYDGAVELKAEQVFGGKAFEVLESSTASSKKVLFDITTFVDGKKTQPNSNVTVKIPLPNGYNPNKTAVYYVTDSGTLEKIPCTVEDGYVVFETNHFSYYAIVDEGSQSNPSENCSCACHKKGIVKFFFKIKLFFQKIFKKNKICKCGVYHY